MTLRPRRRRLARNCISAGIVAAVLGTAAPLHAQDPAVPTQTSAPPEPAGPEAAAPDPAPPPATPESPAAPAPARTPDAPAPPASAMAPQFIPDAPAPAGPAPAPADRAPTTTQQRPQPATGAQRRWNAADPAPASAPVEPLLGRALAGVPSFFIDSFRIPPFLLPIYQAAGIEYGIRWEILAAINEIETDYGRIVDVSSAGAVGWMQFLPSTFAVYGTDANADGRIDPYNPVDAIFSSARYLAAAGAADDLRGAIFAYNHSDAYVKSVLERARLLAALPVDLVSALTGLAQGRPPLLGRARMLDPRAESRRRHSVRLTAGAGAPVVAVADAEVVRMGESARLGRFVQLRDASGNTFTYGKLAHVAQRHPALEERRASAIASSTVSAPAGSQATPLPAPADRPARAQDPAATQAVAPARAGRSIEISGEASLGPAVAAAPADSAQLPKPGAPEAELVVAVTPPAPRQPVAVTAPRRSAARALTAVAAVDWRRQARLMARPAPARRPDRPDPVIRTRPNPTALTAYDRRLFGRAPAGQVVYRPLREGSRVVAGTIIGRAGDGDRQSTAVRFEIRPAGIASPRLDPRPFVAGWRLLQASAEQAPSLGRVDPATIGQVLLLSTRALQLAVLEDDRISLYPCGRDDVRRGLVDRRVLATLKLLALSGLSPTVSSLQCGHSRRTAAGNVSEHASGSAVDISAVNGVPILGHQGPGSITDETVRRLIAFQGEMQPHQIISLMTFAGADNTLAMPDHADHIHVGFAPATSSASLSVLATDGVLQAADWRRLDRRLSAIANPGVQPAPGP